MVKYKNISDHFTIFAIPKEDGGAIFFNAPIGAIIEVPIGEEWRAKDAGLIPLEEVKPVIKPQPVQPIESKKKESNWIIPELKKIKGLGIKTMQEISEEYDSIQEVVSAIKNKTFRVGGVDKDKMKEILRVVR